MVVSAGLTPFVLPVWALLLGAADFRAANVGQTLFAALLMALGLAQLFGRGLLEVRRLLFWCWCLRVL